MWNHPTVVPSCAVGHDQPSQLNVAGGGVGSPGGSVGGVTSGALTVQATVFCAWLPAASTAVTVNAFWPVVAVETTAPSATGPAHEPPLEPPSVHE